MIMARLIAGVGNKDVVPIEEGIFKAWSAMLHRCYGNTMRSRKTNCYDGVEVCHEWLTFSNFQSWAKTRYKKGLQLDKDILCRGSSKIYSPDTCLFVTAEINNFLSCVKRTERETPVGVQVVDKKNPYMAFISKKNKTINLGYYDNPKDAHNAWLKEKISIGLELSKGVELEEARLSFIEFIKSDRFAKSFR
jgi:hypothetical protein